MKYGICPRQPRAVGTQVKRISAHRSVAAFAWRRVRIEETKCVSTTKDAAPAEAVLANMPRGDAARGIRACLDDGVATIPPA